MLTEEEFTQAVKMNMDTVYRVAVNCLRDPAAAEDVCQEVFLRLYRRQPDLQDAQHCRNWLIHVCLNECRRVLASPRSAELSLDDRSALSLFEDPVDNSTFQLVMSLPEKYRTALYLFYYEGYSTAEIAKLLHILPATVRSRLDRGRKQLKQMLLEAEHV